jgi:hypothetical protein
MEIIDVILLDFVRTGFLILLRENAGRFLIESGYSYPVVMECSALPWNT